MAVQPALLGSLLLDLYAGSQELPMQAFLPHALALIKRHLPFDSAWWAMTTPIGGQYSFHASHVEGLPANMHELWLSIQDDDVIGHAVLAHPDITIDFKPEDVDRTNGSRWLARSTGFRHVLCTQNHNPAIAQHHFLALCRHDDSHFFSESERYLKQLLMPHLNATLNINRVAQLRQMHAQGSDRRSAMAVVDRQGAMHTVEPGFVEHLRRQWPPWTGPLVPDTLLRRLTSQDASYAGDVVTVRWSWLGDLALVEAMECSPLDRLSAREGDVALAFAGGATYKEVARQLGLAPTTVRHHLRTIYDKLGVSNKAAVAQIVAAPLMGKPQRHQAAAHAPTNSLQPTYRDTLPNSP